MACIKHEISYFSLMNKPRICCSISPLSTTKITYWNSNSHKINQKTCISTLSYAFIWFFLIPLSLLIALRLMPLESGGESVVKLVTNAEHTLRLIGHLLTLIPFREGADAVSTCTNMEIKVVRRCAKKISKIVGVVVEFMTRSVMVTALLISSYDLFLSTSSAER